MWPHGVFDNWMRICEADQQRALHCPFVACSRQDKVWASCSRNRMFEAQFGTATNGSFVVQLSDTSPSAYLSDCKESFKTYQQRRGEKRKKKKRI